MWESVHFYNMRFTGLKRKWIFDVKSDADEDFIEGFLEFWFYLFMIVCFGYIAYALYTAKHK